MTQEDLQLMIAPAAAPQRHGGSTFSRPSLSKFLIQSKSNLALSISPMDLGQDPSVVNNNRV